MPEQFLRIGPRGGRCVAEGVVPCPGAGVRNRKPAGLRNPRRGGMAEGKTKVFVRRLAGARCPALRSEGLFGSETGSPRTRAVQGTARVSSRGGGRRAEPGLRTSRQKELAATAAKKSPPPGPSRLKRSFFQKGCLPFKEIGKIFVFAKTPTPS